MTAPAAEVEAVAREPMVTIPLADYKQLIEIAKEVADLDWCEVCGAWLDLDDPARATADDFKGCWKVATRNPKYNHLCRSYRATVLEQPRAALDAARRKEAK